MIPENLVSRAGIIGKGFERHGVEKVNRRELASAHSRAFQADGWNGLQRTQALWHWWTVWYCLPNLASTRSHTHSHTHSSVLLSLLHRPLSFFFSQLGSDSWISSLLPRPFFSSSFIISHLLISRHVLTGSRVVSFLCVLAVGRLDRALSRSLHLFFCSPCPCLHTPTSNADPYNHFTRSNNHHFVWRTQGESSGEVKINTQHNQHKQSHQLQFTLRCCERHLEKFQTLKSEVLRDMKSALINILSSGNRLLLIKSDVVFSACLYPAGKKHKGTNVEPSKWNYFTTSFHRHQDHKQKRMNNNSQCLSVWLHMITTVHVIPASLYRRSCHRHFPSVTFINYCTLFPLSVLHPVAICCQFFFPFRLLLLMHHLSHPAKIIKKKTLGIIF